MEAKDLRIGNWVHYNRHGKYGDVIVYQIYKHDVSNGFGISAKDMFIHIYELSPIPLTEEWLLRFGFKKILHSIKGTELKDEYEKGFVRISHYMGQFDFMGSTKINSVNQLQNLYFALTGTEL